MAHLSEENLYTFAFDQTPLTNDAQRHLAECEQCRDQLSQLTQLSTELTFVKRSQLTAQTLTNYYALFEEVQTRPSVLTRSVQWLRAQLSWDSRQQPALQGIRSGVSSTYRLLYSSDTADIEILVEPRNGSRHLVGEIIPLTDSLKVPALLQLVLPQSAEVVSEIECDEQGRFRIDGLKPAEYALSITPRKGNALQIELLELT